MLVATLLLVVVLLFIAAVLLYKLKRWLFDHHEPPVDPAP